MALNACTIAVSNAFLTPTYNKLLNFTQFSIQLNCDLTLFKADVSIYSLPIRFAKSQASDNETGRNPFLWKYTNRLSIGITNHFKYTFKLAIVSELSLKSDWVPTSTSDAEVFRSVGIHLILTALNDSG